MEKEESKSIIKVNSKVYPLEVIYSAAYSFLDKAHIILDSQKEDEIIIDIKPKIGTVSKDKELSVEFSNELIRHEEYRKNATLSKEFDYTTLKEALIGSKQQPNEVRTEDDLNLSGDIDEELFDDDELFNEIMDDPEGIAVPWDEKHSKGTQDGKD